MALRLFDSAAGRLREFVSLVPGQAKIYVCGLTVQSEPHVGHMRSAVAFDVLRRWLAASGYDVVFIRNVTDVDDKIFVKAAELRRPWFNLAYETRRELDRLLTLINVLPPTYEPAATAHVPEVLELIGRLVTAGHAYSSLDGSADVYFDVRSWPAYGELTGQAPDDLEPAADGGSPGKKDPRDFALWKARKAADPETAAWPSPYGPGRPGWHVGCSAMSRKYLGAAFDIHGGGIDLRFPHHENEQAQSRAAGDPFAGYWMHNAWVTAAGEKMSKSLGNSMLVPSVLEHVRPEELRYYLARSHYRSTVEFSYGALREAAEAFSRIEAFVDRAGAAGADAQVPCPAAFVAAMNDDLGTPAAFAVLHETVRNGNRLLADGRSPDLTRLAGEVLAMLGVLGLDPRGFPTALPQSRPSPTTDLLVQGLLAERAKARGRRDWTTADALRDLLRAAGVRVEDASSGTA